MKLGSARALASALFVLLALPARIAAADPPPAQMPPDLVPLESGGMTTTRRADGAVLESGPAAHVRFESDDPGLTFHMVTTEASAVAVGPAGVATASARDYEDLCRAPCEVTLPAGTRRLALASGAGHSPVDGEPVALPAGSSTVRGVYISHATRRAVALVLGGGTMAAGAILLLESTAQTKVDVTGAGVGVGLVFLSLLALPFMGGDEAEFQVIPRASASLTPSIWRAPGREGSAMPGMTLTLAW